MIKQFFLILLACTCLSVKGQKSTTVSGQVSDRNGNILAGTTISALKNQQKAISGYAGFSIKLYTLPDTLLFEHVGYVPKKVLIKTDTETVVIKLDKSAEVLKDVIVNTGYQNLPKERATGAFAFVDNEKINEQVGSNILERLEGAAAGVLFEKYRAASDKRQLKFNIRGLSTINGPQDPLIVIDQFPYEGDIKNINPDDIESITILKDAAASSIWGTRAGNGVVVITTKKAKFNSPLKVNINSQVSVDNVPDLFYLSQMSSADYIGIEQMLFSKGAYNSKINSITRPPLSPAVEVFVLRRSGLITAEDSAKQINKLKSQDIRKDMNRYFYKNAIARQHNISISGGSSLASWIFSGSYLQNTSNLDARYDKINLRINNIYRVTKKLEISTNTLFTRSNFQTGRPGYGNISIGTVQVPYVTIADKSGNPVPVAKSYRQSFTDTAGGGLLLDWNYYPLTDYKHNRATSAIQDINANIALHYVLFPGLKIDLLYQYERQQSVFNEKHDLDSYFTRDLINTYSKIDYADSSVTYAIPKAGILDSRNELTSVSNFRAQLSYNQSWQIGTLSFLFGAESRDRVVSSNGNTIYGYDDEILSAANMDFANPYPTFIMGYDAYIPNGLVLRKTNDRFVSLFSNTAFIVNEKYTISGSIRRDASNLFGISANKRWEPFWSSGLSWAISKERFFEIKWIDNLLLRTSFGYSGNVDQSMSALTTLNIIGSNDYTGFPYALADNFYNPQLRWETTDTWNAGLDFRFFNSAITGSIDYYIKRGTDLFGLLPIDYTVGLGKGSIIKNTADMKSSGIDLSLNLRLIDRTIKWFSQFHFSQNKSITTKYYQGDYTWAGILGSGISISPAVGKPLYSIASYKWGGLNPENGNPRGYLDGKLSEDYQAILNNSTASADSLVFHGPSTPTYFGSLGNTMKWKSFSLNFQILYNLGYYFRKSTISYSSLFNGAGHGDYARRWQKPGDELVTSVPSLIYPSNSPRDQFYRLSEATVDKADNVRLQYINITWHRVISNNKNPVVKSLQLNLNVSNVGIIWVANKEKRDPNYFSSLPPSKQYSLGLSLNF